MKSKVGKQKKKVCIIKSVSREKHSKSNAELKSHILLKKKLKKERQFEDEVIPSQEDQAEKCNFDTARVENSRRENSEEKLKQTKKCSKKHEYKEKIKENVAESSGNDQDEISSKKRKRSREKKKNKNLESNFDNSNHGIDRKSVV